MSDPGPFWNQDEWALDFRATGSAFKLAEDDRLKLEVPPEAVQDQLKVKLAGLSAGDSTWM